MKYNQSDLDKKLKEKTQLFQDMQIKDEAFREKVIKVTKAN
jgi:hypothetical protein